MLPSSPVSAAAQPPESHPPRNRLYYELIDYGGIPCTRAEAILDMQRLGLDQPCIDRWLQGNELAQRIRRRRERLSVSIHLQ